MRALITGISGQDGHYLARHLLDQGYVVTGLSRYPPPSSPLLDGVTFEPCDVQDSDRLRQLINSVEPDEIYHLAAQSSPAKSWIDPLETTRIQCSGTVTLLESIREVLPSTRLFFASSSEVFGTSSVPPLNEFTPHRSTSPYGAAKVFAHQLCEMYREKYGLFVAVGVLFNHESPLRPPTFVSRKITAAAAAIHRGTQSGLTLGGLDMVRDWGFAGDYVTAMHATLKAAKPGTYVIASGIPHTVRDWCEISFETVGLDYRDYVTIDPSFAHGPAVSHVIGDRSKIFQELGWAPSVDFSEMVRMMVDVDVRALGR